LLQSNSNKCFNILGIYLFERIVGIDKSSKK